MSEIRRFNPEEKLDARWFDRFAEYGSVQTSQYLNGHKEYREEQRKQFEAEEIDYPELDYPKIKRDELEACEQGLLDLKKDILDQEQNEDVKQLYRWKINEKIAEIRMLLCTAREDMKKFKRYAEFVFGKPDPEVYAYTIDEIRTNLDQDLQSKNEDLKKAAEQLDHMLPQRVPGDLPDIPTLLPTQQEVGQVQALDKPNTEGMYPEELEERIYTAQEIQQYFEEALSLIGADGWEAVIDQDSATNISVNHKSKRVIIPESRKVQAEYLKKLIVHEIGTHIARGVEGKRSKLMLLSLGLDRYIPGEEGLATLREQLVAGKANSFSRADAHLAISLAAGLDGNKRTFQEVYPIMEAYIYYTNIKAGKTEEQARSLAKKSAWSRCVRTFRGTDCKTPGVYCPKDIGYREGNIGMWNLLKKGDNSIFVRLQFGKYDPTKSRHIEALIRLGITEQDLEEVENKA